MIEFDWDDANAGHIARHGVSTVEAEDAFLDPNSLNEDGSFVHGELRYAQVGQSRTGKLLRVVWTSRDSRVRIVTAYPASRDVEELYYQ